MLEQELTFVEDNPESILKGCSSILGLPDILKMQRQLLISRRTTECRDLKFPDDLLLADAFADPSLEMTISRSDHVVNKLTIVHLQGLTQT